MKFDTYLNMFRSGIAINIIKGMMEYQKVIAKIRYITGNSEEDILKKIADINKGESNIETANMLYKMSSMGKCNNIN